MPPDDAYQPSPLPGAAPAVAASTLPVAAPAAPTNYAPSNLAPLAAAIQHHESGGNPNARSPVGAVGLRQIMPGTFRQWAQPGENINNPVDNVNVSNRMLNHYLTAYGGDPQRAAVAYFSGPGNVAPAGSPTPWKHNYGDGNNTVSQYVANTAGQMGKYGGATTPNVAPAAAPGTTLATPPSFASALFGGSGADGKGLSAVDKLTQAVQDQGGGGKPAPLQNDLAGQQAAAGMNRQQELAAQGQALAAQIRTQGSTPLTWNTKTPGSTAGMQSEPPGTTINSMGSLYG